MPHSYRTTTLGYQRVGRGRAYKWMLEEFWAGKTDAAALQTQARQREDECLITQREAGIALVASGDFSLYDHVLDTAVMLGCIPERYGWDGSEVSIALYFAMARGPAPRTSGGAGTLGGVPACEMTKWFDTNYHYLVPELPVEFRLTRNRPLSALRSARTVIGEAAKP